jgi:hypothetical protein
MSNATITIDSDGIRQLLKSDAVVSVLEQEAQRIIKSCSGSYETNTYIGTNRANVGITTSDRKTFFKNLQDNELLKALR